MRAAERSVACIMIAPAIMCAACSLGPLFDGTYLTTPPSTDQLGFIPKGENVALGARVYTSSSLEDNLGLVNPSRPSAGTWREYAQWIGWVRSAINDGVVQAPESGGGGASSGWCTASASPEESLPAWVIYDFGGAQAVRAFGLFPRTDRPLGPGTNLPQDFALYGTNAVDASLLAADAYGDPSPPEPWVLLPAEGSEDGRITHTGGGFPAAYQEQVFALKSVQTYRCVMLYITRAGGDFVQIPELAVYSP